MAMRLGLRMAKGLANKHAADLVAHRGTLPFRTIEELQRRTGLPEAALERLADADAYRDLSLDRRQALRAVRGLADSTLPLFAQVDSAGRPLPEAIEAPVMLTRLQDGREVVEDYRSVGLSLRRHLVSSLRETLTGMGMTTCGALGRTRDRRKVAAHGLMLMRQKPGTA